MGYNEPGYLLAFLPAAALIYRLCPKKGRKYLLILISWFYFCTFGRKLIVYLIGTTAFVYLMGLAIEKAGDRRKLRQRLTYASVAVLFAVLLYVKYTGFFISIVNSMMQKHPGWTEIIPPYILVPVGISFYTLEAVGYLLEVYWEREKADRDFWRISLFLGFFPQTLEGPIARYSDTAKQFTDSELPSLETIVWAVVRILWGMGKKLVIADRLNTVVNELYGNYLNYDGVLMPVAAVAYAVQLYMEFSGMMDVVIGSAMLFGIKLPENFRHPFFSQTAAEFWRRWHISLGIWLKNYIFYPMTVSKLNMKWTRKARKKYGKYIAKIGTSAMALAPVWLFNGLWHGPQMNYIAYGIYYLIILQIGVMLEPVHKNFYKKTGIRSNAAGPTIFRLLRTWLIIFTGELLFRSDGVGIAMHMYRSTFRNFGLHRLWDGTLLSLGISLADWVAILIGCVVVLIADLLSERGVDFRKWLSARPLPLRWAIYYLMIFTILIFGAYGQGYLKVDLIYAGF